MIYLAPEIKIIFQFFKPESCPMPFMNKWVTAQCPARIDVSGGWSDTPPITYEHGGAVTMIGLQIRGKVWSTTFMYHDNVNMQIKSAILQQICTSRLLI